MDHQNHDMSGMSGMGGSSSSSSSGGGSMMPMTMVFVTGHDTPLFSHAWTPKNNGQYAGTCIFIIVLGVIHRLLQAGKTWMEARWFEAGVKRRYGVAESVATPSTEDVKGQAQGQDPDADADGDASDDGTVEAGTRDGGGKVVTLLSGRGLEERVRVVQSSDLRVLPWSVGVDVPRAIMSFIIAGVSYLL